jgi:hypothetical protein
MKETNLTRNRGSVYSRALIPPYRFCAKLLTGTSALVFTLALILTSCEDLMNLITPLPTVTGVTVTPADATVAKGGTQRFSAAVSGTGDFDDTVTWTVTGGISATSISTTSLLIVATGETAEILTVRAASTVVPDIYDMARVPVITITGVTVTPTVTTVAKGGIRQFSATVTGIGAFDNTVTWSVSGGGAGTGIDTSGLLTVAADETAETFTVRAASIADTTKYGTATVTSLPPLGPDEAGLEADRSRVPIEAPFSYAKAAAWLQENAVSGGTYVIQMANAEPETITADDAILFPYGGPAILLP